MSRRKWALVILAVFVLFALLFALLAGFLAGCASHEPANQVFWASAKSDKYHDPGCRWAQGIHPENKVVFRTTAEARTAGYVPCNVCQPPG